MPPRAGWLQAQCAAASNHAVHHRVLCSQRERPVALHLVRVMLPRRAPALTPAVPRTLHWPTAMPARRVCQPSQTASAVAVLASTLMRGVLSVMAKALPSMARFAHIATRTTSVLIFGVSSAKTTIRWRFAARLAFHTAYPATSTPVSVAIVHVSRTARTGRCLS